MKIRLSSVYVDDQEKALKFYTEVLGMQFLVLFLHKYFNSFS